jgi:hypothetical protein
MFKRKAWPLALFALFLLPAVTKAQAPVFTSAPSAEFVAGQLGIFTVRATGAQPIAFVEAGPLPNGVAFNPATNQLTGTPTQTGNFPINFTASNSGGNLIQLFTLVVDGPAFITSANNASFINGQSGNFTVLAEGSPAPTLTQSGVLPAGVTFTAGTGILAIAATVPAGTYPITFTARNGIGADYAQQFTLTIAAGEDPKFTSSDTVSFSTGRPGAFIVTASGSPMPNVSADIPQDARSKGLTFNPATRILSSTAQTPAGTYQITFTASNGATSKTQVFKLLVGHLGGEIVRAVIGFEQIGASGTASSQSFMFDLYMSRPIPLPWNRDGDPIWGPRVRWWGDVRVSSYPYTQKSSVATFAPQFAAAFGNQNLNQLAESVEFAAGPEIRLWTTGSHGALTDSTAAARYGLMWFSGFGATGPNNPADNATVFQAPFAGSTQETLLNNLYPLPGNKTYANCPVPTPASAPCTNYVAFVPVSADRFLQQWETGLRLYSVFTNKDTGDVSFTAPATVELSLGENAAVTQGHLHSKVLHVAAMYPFSIGPRGSSSVVVFLFGSVNTALKKNNFQNTLTLVPALDQGGNPVAVTSAGVTQIYVDPNRRDTYRIGAGIDLVTVWNKLTTKPAPQTGVTP